MAFEEKVRYESERDADFARWAVQETGGENLRHCIQCGICSATCPLALYMDYTPRRLINLARAGFKQEVLSSFTIWLCASCYSCRVECPKKIQVTDIMYLLKRRAIEEGVYPRRFPIPILAREFGRMVFFWGRVNETLLATNIFLRTSWMKLFGMTRLGLNLMRTGRVSFLPEHIKRRGELRKVLNALDAQEKKAEVSR
jgi:heterodisulfide reductase subunit C